MRHTSNTLGRLAAGLAIACVAGTALAQASPVGTWKTIDDTTGQPRGEVTIVKQNDTYSGALTNVLREDERTKICTKCTDDRKDKPIVGMTILSGMKKTGDNEWSGGTILDPENGKAYSAKMSLSDDGKKLNVRGFIGISLLGRTQTWLRE